MDTQNREVITKANEIAQKAHYGQFRKHSNKPYISHCYDVVNQLVEWNINEPEILAIALLHDTIEETENLHDIDDLWEEMESLDDGKISDVVNELTFGAYNQTKKEYLASFNDKSIEALVIKIADRLCNVRDFLRTDKQYAVKYFNKADSLFKAMIARKKEIMERFNTEFDGYGEIVLARILDHWEDIGLTIAYLEQHELCK